MTRQGNSTHRGFIIPQEIIEQEVIPEETTPQENCTPGHGGLSHRKLLQRRGRQARLAGLQRGGRRWNGAKSQRLLSFSACNPFVAMLGRRATKL